MKWLFVILLFSNALFFGWSYTQSIRRDELNADYSIPVAKRADDSIALFSEMEQPPALHEDASSESWPANKRKSSGPSSAEKYELTGPIKQARHVNYEGDVSVLFDQPLETEDRDAVCYRLGPLSESSNVKTLLTWLQEHHIAYREHLPEEGQEVSYWAYVMPQKSVDELAALIQFLKKQGVDDYRLVRSGKMRNALSLGNYNSIEHVDQQVAKLKEQGYETIVVPQHSDKQARWFDVRIESHIAQEDFLQPLLARDDQFVVECIETTDWSS